MPLYSVSDVVGYLLEIPWLSRSLSNQPLEGLADGVNRIFRVPYMPISNTPVPLFYTLVAGGKTTLTTTSINYETGEVVFTAAPTMTPYGDFRVTMFSTTRLESMVRRGFAEMQVRWRRELYLYDSGSGVVVSSSPTESVDPATGATTFSKSEIQKAFLNRSTEYILCKLLVEDANINAVSYREERMGGLLVDLTRKAKDFQVYLQQAAEELKKTEDAARSECGEESDFGTFIPGPQLINGEWTDDASF